MRSSQCVIFDKPEELFGANDLVFRGTVVETKPTGIAGDHVTVEIATFRVSRVWKGDVGREVTIGTDRPIAKGREYLVFAGGKPPGTTLLCRATEPVENAKAKLEWLDHRQQPTVASLSADQLVAELKEFRSSLPATVQSNGDPQEERRRAIWDRLWAMGGSAMPALNRGLSDPDVQIRRNVALFLGAAGGNWYSKPRQRLDIRPTLSALTKVLADSDERVRSLAAQAVGGIGADASSAVPALVALLNDTEEGVRNSACIGLGGIGPAARSALPAIRKALADASPDVRRFAQRAIDLIER